MFPDKAPNRCEGMSSLFFEVVKDFWNFRILRTLGFPRNARTPEELRTSENSRTSEVRSMESIDLDAYIDVTYVDTDGYLKWYCREYGITTPTQLIDFSRNHHTEWFNIIRSVRRKLR